MDMKTDSKHGFTVQVLQLIDAAVVTISFWLGVLLWNSVGVALARNVSWIRLDGAHIESLWFILPILFVAVPFIPLSLELMEFYKSYGRKFSMKSLGRVLRAHVLVFVGFALLAVILNMNPHRPSLVLGFIVSSLFISARELLIGYRVRVRENKGMGRIRLLLAGRPDVTDAWWEGLDDELKSRYQLMGHYDFKNGELQKLRDLLSDTAAERIVFLVQNIKFEQVTYAIEECEIQGVEVWLAADFVRARICQPMFDYLGNTPMLVLRSTPSLSWSLLVKDVIDRVGSLILIGLTSPFWLWAYIGIKIQSQGPVLYKQERAGRYGKPFLIWKFRTMIVDADAKLEELKKEAGNEMSGPVFKLDDDPRIFSFGQFMRKFSIDELPQLVNVLKGEMSLVGPRPMAMYELPDIEKSEHRRKLSVKPGITCIWQVEGRNTITDFDEWVKLDLRYIDNWSIWLDVKILLKTIPAVLFAKGSK